MVSGRINSLTPSAGVHFWLEALEPDFIPMTSDESNRLNQGVFVDDWGRPEKYLVYKSRPVSGRQMETKEVDAERMLHLKFVRRLHQMRGTSLLSGVLIRLSALKEYEDSELTAAGSLLLWGCTSAKATDRAMKRMVMTARRMNASYHSAALFTTI